MEKAVNKLEQYLQTKAVFGISELASFLPKLANASDLFTSRDAQQDFAQKCRNFELFAASVNKRSWGRNQFEQWWNEGKVTPDKAVYTHPLANSPAPWGKTTRLMTEAFGALAEYEKTRQQGMNVEWGNVLPSEDEPPWLDESALDAKRREPLEFKQEYMGRPCTCGYDADECIDCRLARMEQALLKIYEVKNLDIDKMTPLHELIKAGANMIVEMKTIAKEALEYRKEKQ